MLLKLTLLFVLLNTVLVFGQGSNPQFLAFFSSPPNDIFTYTKIDLSDGSLNISYPENENPMPISVYSYDGVNWYEFINQVEYTNYPTTFDIGSFSDLGYGFIDFGNYMYGGQSKFHFVNQPFGINNHTGMLYLPAWNKNTNDIAILSFTIYSKNPYFYFNHTQYVMDLAYSTTFVAALDPTTDSYYINFIENGARTILLFDTESTGVFQYKFTTDAIANLNATVNMFYTSITDTLYMVESDYTNKVVNLVSVLLDESSTTAASKVVLTLSNQFGSPIDGTTYVYIRNIDRYAYFLTKPTSTTQYTITKVDLTNLQTSSITTDDVNTQYNNILWYH